ncbi:hypothetical protein FEZ48_06210 [Marinilactibacillus psychrotolerans]|uniref:Uncharacterized protein n=1 Tax=Marinilactibacillus psychrotolerans TaxID=191770 RepID=A0A5R9C424_9LACT|nr:hypothetical protein [Marinilactibacillus psychrotolerans]TLQ07572.1 hypothetical protein FEZ48_06210 [Marinilactibacillus psychrotolerans]
MESLKAKGVKHGEALEVEYIGGKVFVNGDIDISYDVELFKKRPIAGTFYPGAETMLNVYNNLRNHFFDRQVKIEVEGELEEMPYEDDVIY